MMQPIEVDEVLKKMAAESVKQGENLRPRYAISR
jgi:hypothetical protein